MISYLFRFLAVAVAGWVVSRMLRGAVRRAAPRSTPTRRDGEMVRDRVCNTFLPRAGALIERVDGETYYFCSEGCRMRFAGSRSAATATGTGPDTP